MSSHEQNLVVNIWSTMLVQVIDVVLKALPLGELLGIVLLVCRICAVQQPKVLVIISLVQHSLMVSVVLTQCFYGARLAFSRLE
jgi:Mg/Co/Ni transporter MgtE